MSILRAGFRHFLLGLATLIVLPTGGALALSVSSVTRPDTDSVILQFAKPGVYPNITRTGPAEISLAFPPGMRGVSRSGIKG